MAKYRVIKELNFSPAYKKYEPKVGDVIDLIENPVYTFVATNGGNFFLTYSLNINGINELIVINKNCVVKVSNDNSQYIIIGAIAVFIMYSIFKK